MNNVEVDDADVIKMVIIFCRTKSQQLSEEMLTDLIKQARQQGWDMHKEGKERP